jgi:hypothetical protein
VTPPVVHTGQAAVVLEAQGVGNGGDVADSQVGSPRLFHRNKQKSEAAEVTEEAQLRSLLALI